MLPLALRLRPTAAALSGIMLAGCGSLLRPDPPGPLPWARDYPPLAETHPQDLPDLSKSPLELEDVLAHAFARNPELDSARELWNAARARPAQVTALPDPRLSYVHFIDEVVTRNGPIRRGISLSQMFPFFGKLDAKGAIAEARARAAWERYAAKGLELTARVKSAYYELYWIHKALRITRENKRLLADHLKVAQTRYAAGRATQQDVLKAQVELSKLSNDLLTLEELRLTAEARLNMLLDRPPGAKLGIPKDFEIRAPEPRVEALFEIASRHNPELREIDQLSNAARESVRSARLDYYPDFVIGVQYQQVDPISLPGAPDSGRDTWSAMLGINLPINLHRRRAGVAEAEARVRALERRRRAANNRIQFEIQDLALRIRTAGRLVQLYREDILPQARQSLHAAEAGYQAGRVEFINLIDAERSLIAFELAFERAKADFQKDLSELERVVGIRLTEE